MQTQYNHGSGFEPESAAPDPAWSRPRPAAVEAARQAEVNAYPHDSDISWKALREELTKFVHAVPPGRETGVVPFAPPEHRTGHRAQSSRAGGMRAWDQPRQN